MASKGGKKGAAKQISSKVANMKFMQRPQEAALKAKMLAEQEKACRQSHWVLKEESASVISLEESILFDRWVSGRRSFQGFNQTIEDLVRTREREENLRDKAAAKPAKTANPPRPNEWLDSALPKTEREKYYNQGKSRNERKRLPLSKPSAAPPTSKRPRS
ncbi:hypothetical protein Pelo_541 [Pelomyxa schiedti]|nr:hypothetical protein Pelo_541 [Pelomyxa schiedti]